MLKLQLTSALQGDRPLRILCIGAHSDDLEIGCSGTVLAWLKAFPEVDVTWVVLSANDERRKEARRSATALLRAARKSEIILGDFRDGYLPAQYADVKEFFEHLKTSVDPDVVLTHWLEDRHQDHRLVAELTWNTWRNQVVLEYEIPKYEGDLKQTNVFVEVPVRLAQRKVAHLQKHFVSQRSKYWFNPENFLAIMRLRGLECRSSSGFAEAFHARKLLL
jgi:LmbE family N-acetylglucosaminyl deacetylase